VLKFIKNVFSKFENSPPARSSKSSPLIEAIKGGDEEKALSLITEKSVKIPDENRTPVVVLLVQHEMIQALREAIKHGARIQKRDRNRVSAYEYALKSGNRELVDLMIDIDSEKSGGEERRTFPLHYAVSFDTPDVVHALLNVGYAVNEPDKSGETPLARALKYGRLKIAALLIKAGANPDYRDRNGNGLFHIGAGERPRLNGSANRDVKVQDCHSIIETWRWIKEHLKLDINLKNNSGQTPYFYRSAHMSYRVTSLSDYIELGVDPMVRDDKGNNLLHVTSDCECCKKLLELGVSKEETNNDGLYPYETGSDWKRRYQLLFVYKTNDSCMLLDFIRSGNGTKAVETINKGVDVNATDENKVTPLLAAVVRKQTKVVEALLEKNASFESKVIESPLEDEIFREYVKGKRYTLKDYNCNPVSLATQMEALDIIELFFLHFVEKDQILREQTRGSTEKWMGLWLRPVVIAIQERSQDMVELFLRYFSEREETFTLIETMFRATVKYGTMEHFDLLLSIVKKHGAALRIFKEEVLCKDPVKSDILWEEVLKESLSESEGTSLLNSAVAKQRIPLILKLYNMGFRVDEITFNNRNQVFFSCLSKSIQLYRSGWQEANHIDSCGRNGMHLAAMYGSTELVAALCKDFPEMINSREWLYGATPLHLAMIVGNLDNVKNLTELKADQSIRTFFEMDAPTLAKAILELKSADFVDEGKEPMEILSAIIDGEKQLLELEAEWAEAVKWDEMEYPHSHWLWASQKAKVLNEKLRSICPEK
jgi:ankyrin repeat protein